MIVFVKRISQKTKKLFERWGKRGGRARAKSLSSHERSAIAEHAARARWGGKNSSTVFLSSVRLKNAQLYDPVYLEEILSDGTWEDWRRLYQMIADRPFGDVAFALEKTCSSVKIYGATALWLGILNVVRGASYEKKKAGQRIA